MSTLLGLHVVSGLLIAVLALPLIGRKVPPNRWYGFRLAPVFDSEDIWYSANEYAGRWLLALGVATMLAAVGFYFMPSVSLDVYAMACLTVVVLVGTPGFLLTLRRTRALASTRR